MSKKVLLNEFVMGYRDDGSGVAGEEQEINLWAWIPRRLVWGDVPECISVGLKREGFLE